MGYTIREHEVMERMWAEGATLAEISAAIGRNPSAVGAYVCNHRALFPRRSLRIYRWMVEDAGVMHDFGVPTTEIASAMGITYHQADLLVRKARAAGLSKLAPKGARR